MWTLELKEFKGGWWMCDKKSSSFHSVVSSVHTKLNAVINKGYLVG